MDQILNGAGEGNRQQTAMVEGKELTSAYNALSIQGLTWSVAR
jgi:hypothetical protein